MLSEHYQVTGARQLRDVQVKLKPVLTCFDNQRLVAMDQSSLTANIAVRQAAGLSDGAINRELALLGKAALRLADCVQECRTSDADLREAARKFHEHNLGTIRSPLVDTVHASALN